ncbi:TonB family protein [Bradyrhizobium sp.]|uniref:TonB family protein n=1 Tax=Bradyrhizobium sp. TaxID=376 RepID=UPI0039E34B7B
MRFEPVAVLRPVHHRDGQAVSRQLVHWALAGLCVVVVHGAIAYTALTWSGDEVAPSELPAAVMIELSPVPVAPETPPQDVALGPQMEMSQVTTPSEQEDKPVEQEKPEVEVMPETKVEIPPLPEKEKSEVTLAPPTPAPQESQDKPKEKPRKPDKPKDARKKPSQRSARSAPATAAPQALDVQHAPTNAAAMAGMSSSSSPATWRSTIMALLNRHKRVPSGGGRGTSTVAFVIDRSGRVLSARLARSSGYAALDEEAVALARRISPLPAPPANVGGGSSILLDVPVSFGE